MAEPKRQHEVLGIRKGHGAPLSAAPRAPMAPFGQRCCPRLGLASSCAFSATPAGPEGPGDAAATSLLSQPGQDQGHP